MMRAAELSTQSRCIATLVGLLLAVALVAAPAAWAVGTPRGHSHGPCDLDMNGDGVFGGAGDCDVCDGDANTDVDEIYVDCDGGDDTSGDGTAANPYKTVGRAFVAADGPDLGEEDAVCIRGTCVDETYPLLIPHDGKPTAFVRSRDHAQNEVRDFEYPDEPFGIYCWDSDNDDDYRSDETCVIDAGPASREWCFKSAKSHFEMAHMTVQNCGAGQTSTKDSGMGLFNADDHHRSHHWWHHNSFVNINKDGIHNGQNRVFGYFQPDGGAIDWLAIENNYVPDFSGYFLRGGQGDGTLGFSDFWRVKNNTTTCHGCDQDSGFCSGQSDSKVKCTLTDVWGALNDVEILNNHSDANVLAWSQGAATGWNVHSCTQGWDIVNNELIDFQDSILLEAIDSKPVSTCVPLHRPMSDINIAGNEIVLRNKADWGGEHLFPFTIAPGGAGGGEFETVKSAQIVNNTVHCESGSSVGFVFGLHAAHDSPSCPGGHADGLIEVYNNTSNCDYSQSSRGGIWIGTRGTSGPPLSCAHEGYRIRNNILVGRTDRDCVIVEQEWTGAALDIDHQVYDPACTWKWKETSHLSLSGWQAQAGVDDSDSVTCMPAFMNSIEPDLDLHLDPLDICARTAGETLGGASAIDRDGELRTFSPDIGSDEVSLAPQACTTNSDCDDTLFCTGTETCDAGACVGSEDPCFGSVCDEAIGACGGCTNDADCDDGNECTTDTCAAEVCMHVPSVGACDDGLACTTGDACDTVGGCVGVPVDCSGLNDGCIEGACDPTDGTCIPMPLPDGSSCDDGMFCNGAEQCTGGVCLAGDDPCPGRTCDEASAVCDGCIDDLDCDDGDACTSESCVLGVCESSFTTDSCNDGDPCTMGDVCDGAGSCIGSAVDCTGAGDACNDGICDALTGLCIGQPKADGTDCADASFCNGAETCFAGICQAGSDPCAGQLCDEGADVCTDCIVDGDCIDGNFCNGAEACVAGTCQAGFYPCAGRLCDEAGDVCADCLADGDCIDADFCNGTESCLAGVCQGGADPCAGQLCDESGDVCADCLADGDCIDADFCNGAESCVAGSCQAGSDPCVGQICDEGTDLCADCLVDGDCIDADFCNGAEACVAGVCQAGTDPCAGQLCDEGADVCADCLVDGDCIDADFCNGAETCVAGTCQAGSDPCAGQLCDESGDVCADCLIDGDCIDADFCNGAESCVAGVCQAGSDPCAGQLCDESGDVCADCLVDGDCIDADFCNGTESCLAGVCQGGSDPCAGQLCDESGDVCADCLIDGDCIDADFCNGAEACVAGVCQAGTDPCAGQLCDEGADLCADCLVDGDCIDADFCNGTETCIAGTCQAGTDPCAGQLCDEGADLCADCLVDGDCIDADFCNGAEACVAGVCQAGTDPCTGQLCDENSDVCADCLVDGDCIDADFCNGAETCVAGTCQAGSDPCAGQLCDESGDFCADCLIDGDCIDADFCNGAEACVAGVCQAGTDPCAGQLCDEGADGCTDCRDDGDCDDGDACTSDACIEGACEVTFNTDPCDDGDLCTTSDTCDGTGLCVGSVTDCTAVGDACNDGLCDALTGGCITQPKLDGTDCADTDFCNGEEICVAGVCDAGSDPCGGQLCDETGDVCVDCLVDADCDDAETCTTDNCVAGACEHPFNTDPCSDDDLCTTGDVCDGAGLCVGSVTDCTGAGDACNEGVCDILSGNCITEPKADGTSCADALFCNGIETCAAGVCEAGGDPCPGRMCDESGDQCEAAGDVDNDGLIGVVDPCPTDARNACYGIPAIDGGVGTPIRVNANVSNKECSGDKTACDGTQWFGDFGYNQSQRGSSCSLDGGGEACVITGIVELFGCEDEETEDLFQCEHSDRPSAPDLVYDFDLPDGEYLVNLYFADTELNSSDPGDRMFDIFVEGQLEYPAFDAVVAAGSNARAVVRSVVVSVEDGNGLSIHFESRMRKPAIKALEVLAPF